MDADSPANAQSPNAPRGPAAGGASGAAAAQGGSGLRSPGGQLRTVVEDALDRGRAGIAESAYAARDSMADDMSRLREDMARMTETLSRFAAETGGEAGKTLRAVGPSV